MAYNQRLEIPISSIRPTPSHSTYLLYRPTYLSASLSPQATPFSSSPSNFNLVIFVDGIIDVVSSSLVSLGFVTVMYQFRLLVGMSMAM
ncbi:hypothetical protein QQG55_36470 [Brugia pahangi]|uniref:Transmembrane protein n=1 Tax=Brugia pahangi TaxID=6280 RepID=A0A0N4TZ98_BRUPA|nr:unnamed protein product [Brugia pahangi]